MVYSLINSGINCIKTVNRILTSRLGWDVVEDKTQNIEEDG